MARKEILIAEYQKRLIGEIAYVEELRDKAELDTSWDLFNAEAGRLRGQLEATENILGLLRGEG